MATKPEIRVRKKITKAPTPRKTKEEIPLDQVLRETGLDLSDEDIDTLLKLRYPDGYPILVRDDISSFYNVVNMLMKAPVDDVISFLQEVKVPSDLIYMSPLFDAEREKVEIELDNLQTKTSVAEGIFTCPRCKSKKTLSSQKQVRSADEPMSTFVKCLGCGHQWRED